MSQSQYLADLEARAFANTSKIQQLSTINSNLRHENERQETLIARFSAELDNEDIEDAPVMTQHSHTSGPHNRAMDPTPPGPLHTPFYILARTAPHLTLNFVVQGMQGETLQFPIRNVDLAFLLERTLKRKGWRDETVQRSVLGWLQVPMMGVAWRGKDEEVGILDGRE